MKNTDNKIMKIALLVFNIFVISGCAYSIKEVDVSNSDQSCVRDCSKSYSRCVSGGPSVGAKTETLRACKESFEICINTCRK